MNLKISKTTRSIALSTKSKNIKDILKIKTELLMALRLNMKIQLINSNKFLPKELPKKIQISKFQDGFQIHWPPRIYSMFSLRIKYFNIVLDFILNLLIKYILLSFYKNHEISPFFLIYIAILAYLQLSFQKDSSCATRTCSTFNFRQHFQKNIHLS